MNFSYRTLPTGPTAFGDLRRFLQAFNGLGRGLRPALLTALVLLSCPAFAQNAVPPGVVPVLLPNPRPTGATTGFAIDGDLAAYDGDAAAYRNAGDWLPNPLTAAGYGGALSATGAAPVGSKRIIHKTDAYGATDDIFAGGSKIDSNPNTSVTWKTGGPNPSKNDINNAMVYIEEGTASTGAGIVIGDTWVTMAGDRATKEGNSFLAFQFLQKTLVRNADGTFTSAGTDGGRTVGDVQVTAEFVNGGTVPNLYYEEWRPAGTGFTWVQLANPPSGAAFGRTNGVALTNVPYAPFGGTLYEANLFAEVSVDISAVYRGVQTTCVGKISTLWVVTKSSQSSSANMTDFVEPIPLDLNINVVADAGADKAMCAGGSAKIGATAVAGYSYAWSIGNASPFATTAEVTVSPAATTTYKLTVTKIGSTCSSPPDEVTVTVNGNPTAQAGTAPAAQCAAASNTFSLSGSGTNGTPSWAVFNNPSSLSVNITGGDTYTPSVAVSGGSGTVTLRLTVTSNATPSCGTATSDVAVTVNPNPTAGAGTAPAAQCAALVGNTFSLSGTATNGTPLWTVFSNPSSLAVTITGETSLTPSVAVSGGSGVVTLRLTVTSTANPVCTAATSNVAVTVNPNPTAQAGTAPAAQCLSANGNTFSLSGSGTNGTPSWAVFNNPSSLSVNITGGDTYTPSVAVSGGSGTVTLRLTVTSNATPSCGTATSDVAVTVNAKPAGPTVTVQEASLCGALTAPTLTVCNPVAGTTYRVTETDGTNPQTATYSAGPLVFVMRAGKGFSITATASAAAGGCISAATVCGGQAESCPAPPAIRSASVEPTTIPSALQGSIQTEAYPNPTTRDATINFTVPTSGHVVVQLYNAIGVPVATLFDGQVVGGETRTLQLKGAQLAAGTYTYRVMANGKAKTNRVSLVR
ncbi:T9SS type A sorting domain-containing protein [Hymenobacter armeniacus]|uniref:T9SS type A sorting domain-containing protein n=1 Tax=Hymenobacter armeniacus TaxID=2771358 RepID=A0ABR8JWB6_9BACT|nr:T9SS type A sorting domain-containing protein [Hymenobacter armeniacus]MBD2723091.1 T9SS type A sorting domain-containing protein [Hymenobacter armeniacus]